MTVTSDARSINIALSGTIASDAGKWTIGRVDGVKMRSVEGAVEVQKQILLRINTLDDNVLKLTDLKCHFGHHFDLTQHSNKLRSSHRHWLTKLNHDDEMVLKCGEFGAVAGIVIVCGLRVGRPARDPLLQIVCDNLQKVTWDSCGFLARGAEISISDGFTRLLDHATVQASIQAGAKVIIQAIIGVIARERNEVEMRY